MFLHLEHLAENDGGYLDKSVRERYTKRFVVNGSIETATYFEFRFIRLTLSINY